MIYGVQLGFGSAQRASQDLLKTKSVYYVTAGAITTLFLPMDGS
jgi:hypothetical protein